MSRPFASERVGVTPPNATCVVLFLLVSKSALCPCVGVAHASSDARNSNEIPSANAHEEVAMGTRDALCQQWRRAHVQMSIAAQKCLFEARSVKFALCYRPE